MDPLHDDSLGAQVSRLMFEVWGRLRAHLDDVAGSFDLTPMQARALHHLGEPCPMGDVAGRLGCDASNVTGIVDRLEERGFVQRQLDTADRRRRLLVTTPRGEAVREEMGRRMIDGHPILRSLTTDQQQTLHDLLVQAVTATTIDGHPNGQSSRRGVRGREGTSVAG